MYIRFLPGTLPPLYQELHDGWTRTVAATSEVAWSIHSCCAVADASMVRIPLERRTTSASKRGPLSSIVTGDLLDGPGQVQRLDPPSVVLLFVGLVVVAGAVQFVAVA